MEPLAKDFLEAARWSARFYRGFVIGSDGRAAAAVEVVHSAARYAIALALHEGEGVLDLAAVRIARGRGWALVVPRRDGVARLWARRHAEPREVVRAALALGLRRVRANAASGAKRLGPPLRLAGIDTDARQSTDDGILDLARLLSRSTAAGVWYAPVRGRARESTPEVLAANVRALRSGCTPLSTHGGAHEPLPALVTPDGTGWTRVRPRDVAQAHAEARRAVLDALAAGTARSAVYVRAGGAFFALLADTRPALTLPSLLLRLDPRRLPDVVFRTTDELPASLRRHFEAHARGSGLEVGGWSLLRHAPRDPDVNDPRDVHVAPDALARIAEYALAGDSTLLTYLFAAVPASVEGCAVFRLPASDVTACAPHGFVWASNSTGRDDVRILAPGEA